MKFEKESSQGYLSEYANSTNSRVRNNPHRAVGGHWEQIGLLQFNFLINEGLQPFHKFLDIGCGTLRGGLRFIQFLNSKNYTGIDISNEAIDYSFNVLKIKKLLYKHPNLKVTNNLLFKEFKEQSFDFILAQSVFNHLKEEYIKECFENIGNVMTPSSIFYFTFKKGKIVKRHSIKGFVHPFSFFKELSTQNGFIIEDVSYRYQHPYGLSLVKLVRV